MYRRVFYELLNLDNGQAIRLDSTGVNYVPRNWENAEPTYKRSIKNFSETREFSKELEFTGGGATFLREAYAAKDVEANVQIKEYRINPNTDVPYINSIGYLDFSDYSSEKTIVKVPINSGGLQALVNAKQNDKFELERETSITGDDIGTLSKQEFAAVSRPLFLNSLLETDEDEPDNDAFRMRYGEDFRYGAWSVPMSVSYESDDSVGGVISNQFQVVGASFVDPPNDVRIQFNNPLNERSMLFYYNNSIDRNIKLKLDIDFYVNFRRNDNLESHYGKLALIRYTGFQNPEFIMDTSFPNQLIDPNFIILEDLQDIVQGTSRQVTHQSEIELTLLEGESLALVVWAGGEFSVFGGAATLDLNFENINSSITIEEDSVRNDIPRRVLCLRNEDAGKRLMQIINNDANSYQSEYLRTGEFKNSALTSGKLLRGFNDSTITTSLKDYLANTNALFNMGWNIEIVQGKEVLVHEPLKHFFRQETVIKLPNQVSDVKRTVAKEFIFNTIKSGYKKPSGDNLYEEVNGLNEYNVSNSYITPITKVIQEYDIESPYRADSAGKELTIRQHKQINPTGDYRTDKTIFNLDLKFVGTNVLAEKTWQDIYENEPIGGNTPDSEIYSSSTLTGLNYTPFRNMERHFWAINSALTKETDKYIRYTETKGNSDLTTKKAGEEERSENGSYLIEDLETPRFVSQWIEFSHEVDFQLSELIYGKTNVNGRDIPNTYFKIEFINEFNEKEYGYLFELKPNKEGKWKVLKAL
ncbi:hypothetical protein [Tenacibaculum phage JQ]|nr:hypothetical protein [Tenacibaculum phage JQ]